MGTTLKIAIAGTHSTGKTSFLSLLRSQLEQLRFRVAQLPSLATSARARGFPILREHTYDSTLWIIGATMQQEAEASLTADVVLVDRPVIDALAYLTAALEFTGRSISPQRLLSLRTIVEGHTSSYDRLFVTELDETIPLAPGRDQDLVFRAAVARQISIAASTMAPEAQALAATHHPTIAANVVSLVKERFGLLAVK